jgi:threonine/homoserine/homoserine lactone efflux protein
MIPLESLLPFLSASILVTLAPGPDILYVLTRGMAEGRRVALAAAAGFASGVFVHTLLAAAGLSALMMASPQAFRAVKLAGAAYLIYLGVRMGLDRGRVLGAVDAERGETPAATRPGAAYRQSVVANVLNPKVAVFFVSFLPRFVRASEGSVPWQFATLGLVFALQAWACFSAVAVAASWIGARLQSSERAGRVLVRVAGAVLVALGVSLAWS